METVGGEEEVTGIESYTDVRPEIWTSAKDKEHSPEGPQTSKVHHITMDKDTPESCTIGNLGFPESQWHSK